MEIEFGKNELGRGGFGIVFNGFWGPNRTPVAVKRILLEDVQSNVREEDALRNLNHPNVIKLYHAESNSSFRFYALQLCEASLDKLFLKDGDAQKCYRRMPPREDVLFQLAIGLQYIHLCGMIHHDIKPQNILIWVNPQNEEVLMKWSDFGLSKRVNERGTFSMSTGVRGTDGWMAPELLKLVENLVEDLAEEIAKGTTSLRKRGTIKSDVFAEGLVFGYFYLDGEHVFGSIQNQTSINIMKNNPVNINKIQPTHVHNLVAKMLTSSPEKRITSSDVVKLLEEYRAQTKRVVLPGSMLEIDTEKILENAGYGIIFQGVWGTTRLPVAVKRMQLIHALGKKQEEIWLSLSHDNVVKLFHAENDSKFSYYALELCQASLDKLFLKDGDPKKYCGPKPQTEEALYQLAAGLEYVHNLNLIHCDLKPKNVLVWIGSSSAVVLKWTNFGSSKQADEKGTCPIIEFKGASEWLAPEILKSLENDDIVDQSDNQFSLLWECFSFESDVFAEGMVFGYYLLDGAHPFGSIGWKIQANISQNDPVNMKKIQPSPLLNLTLQMLTHNPDNRLTSSDVVEEFRDIRKSQQMEMEKMLFNLCLEPKPNLKNITDVFSRGINVKCRNEDGLTPLLQLLANGTAYNQQDFIEIVKFFVEKDIDLNVKNAYEENALLKLITHYQQDDLMEIVKLFVEHGTDINCKNKYGTNILHYLCEYYTHDNLIDIIQFLIEKGVEINCTHDYGYNALPVLCRNYRNDNLIDVIRLLIENGIEVHCNPSNDGNALNILCRVYKKDNMMDIVKLLGQSDEIKKKGNSQVARATKRKHN